MKNVQSAHALEPFEQQLAHEEELELLRRLRAGHVYRVQLVGCTELLLVLEDEEGGLTKVLNSQGEVAVIESGSLSITLSR